MNETLELITYAIGITGSLFIAAFFLARARREWIEQCKTTLQRQWTNEGGVHAMDPPFLNLKFWNSGGNTLGTLTSSAGPKELEIFPRIHWGFVVLHIYQMSGRELQPMAKVLVRIGGNKDLLIWRVVENQQPAILPQRTVLWPSPAKKS